MKKYSIIAAILLLNYCLFAQRQTSEETGYYYSNGEKVELPINKQHFTVYFDLGQITKNNISKQYNVVKKIQLPTDNNMSYCCIVANLSCPYSICSAKRVNKSSKKHGTSRRMKSACLFYLFPVSNACGGCEFSKQNLPA